MLGESGVQMEKSTSQDLRNLWQYPEVYIHQNDRYAGRHTF